MLQGDRDGRSSFFLSNWLCLKKNCYKITPLCKIIDFPNQLSPVSQHTFLHMGKYLVTNDPSQHHSNYSDWTQKFHRNHPWRWVFQAYDWNRWTAVQNSVLLYTKIYTFGVTWDTWSLNETRTNSRSTVYDPMLNPLYFQHLQSFIHLVA